MMLEAEKMSGRGGRGVAPMFFDGHGSPHKALPSRTSSTNLFGGGHRLQVREHREESRREARGSTMRSECDPWRPAPTAAGLPRRWCIPVEASLEVLRYVRQALDHTCSSRCSSSSALRGCMSKALPGTPFADEKLTPRSGRSSTRSTVSTTRCASSTRGTWRNVAQGDLGNSFYYESTPVAADRSWSEAAGLRVHGGAGDHIRARCRGSCSARGGPAAQYLLDYVGRGGGGGWASPCLASCSRRSCSTGSASSWESCLSPGILRELGPCSVLPSTGARGLRERDRRQLRAVGDAGGLRAGLRHAGQVQGALVAWPWSGSTCCATRSYRSSRCCSR